jgi:hypothetical protein
MADNNFFKEVFDSEFSKLIATGISRQNAAAQALSSARTICSERARYNQPVQLPPVHLTTGTANPLSDFDQRGFVGVEDTASSSATNTSIMSTSSSVEVPGQVQDRRKGKLAANVYSMPKKRIPSLAPVLSNVVPPINYDDFKRLLVDCGSKGDYSPVIRLVGSTFSSAEAMNKSFNLPDVDSCSTYQTASNSSNSFSGKAAAAETGKSEAKYVKDEDSLSHISNTRNIENDHITKASLVSLSSSVGDIAIAQNTGHSKFDRISIDIDRVSDVFQMLFSTSHEGSVSKHTHTNTHAHIQSHIRRHTRAHTRSHSHSHGHTTSFLTFFLCSCSHPRTQIYYFTSVFFLFDPLNSFVTCTKQLFGIFYLHIAP